MAPTSTFPEPLVVPPLLAHKHTFILLHGRGASAGRFGPALLSTPVAAPEAGAPAATLRAAFPHARFVFPTAPPSRATIYRRSTTNQWFDGWHLAGGGGARRPREELQAPGLRRTVAFVHGLLRREVELAGGDPRAVVLGGLSQGCAAGLIAALLWEGGALGAVVGMCGWIPYRAALEEAAGLGDGAAGEGREDGFDPFERPPSSPGPGTETGLSHAGSASDVVAWLRDELEMGDSASEGLPLRDTAVFLGHGARDDRVPVALGREAASFLQKIGTNVTLRVYDELGHWYSQDMLRDLIAFVQEETHWAPAGVDET